MSPGIDLDFENCHRNLLFRFAIFHLYVEKLKSQVYVRQKNMVWTPDILQFVINMAINILKIKNNHNVPNTA